MSDNTKDWLLAGICAVVFGPLIWLALVVVLV